MASTPVRPKGVFSPQSYFRAYLEKGRLCAEILLSCFTSVFISHVAYSNIHNTPQEIETIKDEIRSLNYKTGGHYTEEDLESKDGATLQKMLEGLQTNLRNQKEKEAEEQRAKERQQESDDLAMKMSLDLLYQCINTLNQ